MDEIGKNPLAKIGGCLSIIAQVLKQLLTNRLELCYLAITAKGIVFNKDTLIVLLIKQIGRASCRERV